MSLEELRVELSQSINAGFQKIVGKIRWKCPISNVNRNVKFHTIAINRDGDMIIMFIVYHYYQTINSVMELYVDFEEVVARAGPSAYLADQHYNKFVPSSYLLSLLIFYFANFYFKINFYSFYYDYYDYCFFYYYYYYYIWSKVCSTLISCWRSCVSEIYMANDPY